MATGATSRAMPHFFFSKKLSTLMAKLKEKRQSKSSKTQDEKSSKKKKNTLKPSKNQGKTNIVHNTSGGSGNFVKMQDIRNKILALRDLLDLSPCIGSASVNELLVWTLKDLQRLHPNIKANISMSKLETALSHQILQCFCGFLKSIGDAWTEDIKWRAKIKYDENKDLNQEDLERIAVELLDHITELARERMYDMVDDDHEQPKGSSPRYNTFGKALSETSESYSESEKTSLSSSPCTPTSVLPRTSFSRNGSYSPPRLLPLRVQAVERLNPIDLKRLSFHMVSQMASQDPNYFIQRKEMQMDQHLDVDLKNVGEDREVRSGDAYLTFQMEEDMMDIKMTISLKPKTGKNCATDTYVKPAPGIVDVDVVPPPPSLPKVRSRLDLLSPATRVSTTASPSPEVQESVHESLVSEVHPPLPLVLESDENILPESSETVSCSQDMLVNVKTEQLPQPNPAEQTTETTISEVPPPQPSVTSSNEITLSTPPPPPPPPPFVAKQSAPLPPPPPPPPPPFVAKHTAPAPPPPPPTVAKGTTPAPPPPPPTVAKGTTPAPPPPPPTVAKGTAVAPPSPPPCVAKSTTPPPPPSLVAAKNTALPPPPPPPGTSKGGVPAPPPPMLKGGAPPPPPGLAVAGARQLQAKKCITKLKRSSQMGALYRVLKGKVEGSDTNLKSSRKGKIGGGASASPNGKQGMADALAEMTKRSAYFQQIEEDVKNHAKAIQELKVSISSFQTSDMVELINFHKNVESLLEKLSDETQVLARFEDFPSKKLEALRMAANLYKKLDDIAMTLQNWKIESPVNQLLVKVENYFTKIRGDLDALERTKDEEAKRFQAQKIQFDFQILVRIKELLVELSSNCMELALKERRETTAVESGEEIEMKKKSVSAKVLWKAFQFAYRVYSFAGGHDERADQLTRELAHEIQIDPTE